MNREQRLAKVAARQRAAFTADQALAAGFTRPMMRTNVRNGRWNREHPGVFSFAGSPAMWDRSLFAAWLAGGEGAVVSHLAAARLHGLVSADPRPAITVPRERRVRLQGVEVHQATLLHRADVIEVEGLKVTSPTKTAIDLCSKLTLDPLVDLFDRLFTSGLSLPRYVRRRAAAYPSQGRAGSRLLGRLLERYPEGERPPESKEERRLLRLLSQRPGVPPLPQLALTLLNGDEIRVDAGYPSALIAIELQSYRFHAGAGAFALDAARATELAAIGWTWVPITPWDVRHRPAWVLDRVARIEAATNRAA